MRLSLRRVRAIAWKELREFRRNRSIVAGMSILPLVFLIQPLVAVFGLRASASGALAHEHVLLYMLGIPALVPVLIAAYGVAGERQQDTLEPALTTPIRGEEFLLGKALAALLPSLAIAYGVFALFLVLVELFAQPGIASALIRWPDLIAQVIFTPLIATWSIWVGLAVSARTSDVRVAQQLGMLAGLPAVFEAVLIALNVIEPSTRLAVALAVLLLVLDGSGWRIISATFDRERLITGSKGPRGPDRWVRYPELGAGAGGL
jgi:ABC-2 type transport system permease protein